jgi:hypothetical protein
MFPRGTACIATSAHRQFPKPISAPQRDQPFDVCVGNLQPVSCIEGGLCSALPLLNSRCHGRTLASCEGQPRIFADDAQPARWWCSLNIAISNEEERGTAGHRWNRQRKQERGRIATADSKPQA